MKSNGQLYIFLGKAFGLFLLWNIVYYYWIQNGTDLEFWLTSTTAQLSAGLLNIFGFEAWSVDLYKHINGEQSYSVLFLNGQESLGIADSCNALTLIVLFIGFIIAYPGNWRYKALFITAGTLAIFFINLLRVQILIFNYLYFRASFDFNHHYTFTIAVYLCVFYFWMLWANRFSRKSFFLRKEKAVA